MCDCCEKIIKKIPVTGPTGPQGDPGSSPTRYFESYGEVVLSDEGDPFVYTVTQPGDYVLQFNAYITRTNPATIISLLIKNGVLQSVPFIGTTNTNYYHQNDELIGIAETVLTHNAKLTGVIAGDSIGFSVSDMTGDALLTNASLTILKLT